MRRMAVWLNVHPIRELFMKQFKRVISTASQDIPEESRYLSLETERFEIEGRKFKQVTLVNEQEQVLVDLSLKSDAKSESSTDHPSEDHRNGALSLKQALDTLRSHLTSDTVLVSLSSNAASSLLGLKEGTDFRSHLNLIDAFTVSCKHCQRIKTPSQTLLKAISATLHGDAMSDVNEGVNSSMRSMRMFKHYLKIRNDSEAWDAMSRQLLKGEASPLTEAALIGEKQTKIHPSSKTAVPKDIPSRSQISSTEQRTDGQRVNQSQRRQWRRPLFSIDAEFVLLEKAVRNVGQVALVNENGKVLLDVYIKQTRPVIKYGTAINGLTKEILKTKGISFYKAAAKLRRLLPEDAVIIGLGIHQDIQRMTLRAGVDFHSAVDLGDIFKSFVCPVCNRSSRPSLDHMSDAILGTQSDGRPHNATDDARRSIEIYKRYLGVRDDPVALKQLKRRIAETPKPPRPGGGLADRDGA